LPGFEDRHRFVLLDQPELAPLVHLQSLEIGNLCFLAIPVRSIDPAYEASLSSDDRETLALEEAHPPTLDLALLSASREGRLTANLLAPIVIDLATHRGVQAVRCDSRYSHQHALNEVPVCS
jgi:flagellar assembly factor FliW